MINTNTSKPQNGACSYPTNTHVAHTFMQHALLGVPVSITACIIMHMHAYVCICVGVDRCMPCVQHASSDCMVIRMYIRVCMCVSLYVSDHISLCDQEPYQMNVPHHQRSSASTLPYTSSSHSLTHKGEASHSHLSDVRSLNTSAGSVVIWLFSRVLHRHRQDEGCPSGGCITLSATPQRPLHRHARTHSHTQPNIDNL
jgi:hypothetical protein